MVFVGGVRLLVHLAEMVEGDVGVNLCGVELLVAKKGLKRSQVGSVLEHQSGSGVANHVATSTLLDANGVQVSTNQLSHGDWVKVLAGRSEEETIGATA